MKELDLRKVHRLMGIVIAPLIILQALSGVLLSVDWLLGIHRRAGDAIKENIPRLLVLWDMILVDIHYGMGVGGAFLSHSVGVAAIGVATSGLMIFLKVRARQKKE